MAIETNECTAIAVQLHGETNECTAIAWRNKWMSTYNMEKLMNVQL